MISTVLDLRTENLDRTPVPNGSAGFHVTGTPTNSLSAGAPGMVSGEGVSGWAVKPTRRSH